MKKRMHWILAGVVMLLLCSALFVGAMAETSGTCGDNLTWTLDDEGTLTISGTGDMNDYYVNSYNDLPNTTWSFSVKRLVIEEGVTGIGKNAFYQCKYLESVTIANSVTEIRDYAFGQCSALREIEIPDSVTSIGSYLFKECRNLRSVKLSASITDLNDYLFYFCRWLTNVTIPDSVTSIGVGVFYGCEHLGDITIPDDVVSVGRGAFDYTDYYGHVVRCASLDSNAARALGKAGYSFRVPGTAYDLKYLYDNDESTGLEIAWLDKEVTSFIIPDGVTSIGDYAFRGSRELIDITIPDSVTTIGYNAFDGCTALKDITIPDSVTTLQAQAFYECNSLTNVKIPGSVKTFGANVFYSCDGLESVTIEEGVPVIGSAAFAYCANLKNVSIPESVTNIYNNVFENCTGLTHISIPDGVKKIYNSAFRNCSSLTDVTIGNGVTEISEQVFYHCTRLTSLTIPESVTRIGDYAFEKCESLTGLIIPDSVKNIGTGAFTACKGMAAITIPDSVTGIGSAAFSGCSGITYFVIPDSVTALGSGVFAYCSSLRDITIGNGVTSIGNQTFKACSSLKAIEIPKRVQTLGNEVFADCTSLEQVILPDGLTEMGPAVFSGCSAIQGINLPANLLYIPERGFLNCSSLRDLVLPEGIEAIGPSAFSGCTTLESITFPGTLKLIFASAFKDCESLINIYYNGTEKQLKQLKIDPTENDALLNAGLEILCQHKWGKPVYTWSEDDSKLTATRKCQKNKSHIETETVDVTCEILEEAGCTTAGKARYQSAEFENPAFGAQSKTEELSPKGHEWGEAEFTWAENLSCNARFTCLVCGTAREVPAKVTCEITAEPGRDQEGEAVCTAEAELNGKACSETKTVPLPAGICLKLANTGKNTGAAVSTTDSAYILPLFSIEKGWRVAAWKSTKPTIASVSGEGKLTVKSAGKTIITATAIQSVQKGKKTVKKKITASIALTVVDPTIPTSISFDQGASMTMYLGKPVPQLTVSAQPTETASNAVTWMSSSAKVLKVDKNTGALTPVKAGTAKITATSTKNKKAKATITVTVVDLTVPAGITITAPTTEVAVKGTLQLNYELLRQDPEVPTKSAVTWKTNNKKIAKVDKNGVVTGLKEGTVVITATTTVGKKVAEITLTVKAPTGAEETVELPDIEPSIDDPAFDEPVLEEPAVDEPSDEPTVPEEPVADMEWSDWYGEMPVADGAEQYEEF